MKPATQTKTVETVHPIDPSTVLVIAFAICVVIFLSSLPWLIGAVMDRRRRGRAGRHGAVIRRDDFESRA